MSDTKIVTDPRREAVAKALYRRWWSVKNVLADAIPAWEGVDSVLQSRWYADADAALAAADAAAPALPDDPAGEKMAYDGVAARFREVLAERDAATARAEAAEKELADLIHDMERLKDSETHFVNENEQLRALLREARDTVFHETDHGGGSRDAMAPLLDRIDAHLAGAPK